MFVRNTKTKLTNKTIIFVLRLFSPTRSFEQMSVTILIDSNASRDFFFKFYAAREIVICLCVLMLGRLWQKARDAETISSFFDIPQVSCSKTLKGII